METVLKVIFALYLLWIPVSCGVQALHQHQDGKPFHALGLMLVGMLGTAASTYFNIFAFGFLIKMPT